VGGRTGRDGIHGATLSSADLDSDADTIWSTAVQIGNPITEKKMLDVLLRARDLGMYEGITDCGAGGLSSAVGEMGEKCGAEVDLETVPLKYDGLTYTEIWISEAQERMVLSVPTDKLDELLNLFDSEDVEATPIGRFTDSGRLVLRYQGVQVADMEMGFLHDGVPQTVRKAVWAPPATSSDSHLDQPGDLTHSLSSLLSTENIASKEWVIRQYDHEVQGTSVIKPLVGASNDGPSDAAVIRPVLSSYKGVAISNGINPHYGLLDPYHMATLAIDEAVRQIIAVGGRRDRTAILDNFCWGNPEDSQRLGEFVRAAKGCHDGALAFETPFISGKDSFYNEFNTDDSTIAIPPTLLISAVSVMDDARLAVSMDFKAPGDLVYIVGDTRDEMGGSHYYMLHNELGTDVPQVDLERAPQIMDALTGAIENGLVRACHDCSEGGLGVAIAEMAFAGEIGVDVDLARVVSSDSTDRDDHLLFSESPTRFIVEIAPNDRNCFEATLSGFPFSHMGDTNDSDSLAVVGTRGKTVVAADIFDLKEAWQAPLRSV
ncbi:MAG: AIR synthase-related protein, partial [Candidatus Latescibacteria bacterium]|nr:AIR synthase-related protein [Candidatus Latescibacterota bacterium]